MTSTPPFFTQVAKQFESRNACFYQDKYYAYKDLLTLKNNLEENPLLKNIQKGEVIALQGDFSPFSIALFFHLMERECVIIPMTSESQKSFEVFCKEAEIESIIRIKDTGELEYEKTSFAASHKLTLSLKSEKKSGLILFSSGSSGKPKAILHDLNALLEPYTKVKAKEPSTLITFLLFDHIGGINSLFHALSHGLCIAILQNRNPSYVCSIIEKCKVNILPTSPTFLNLLLLSQSYKNYDLSSLEIISYGTEPMLPSVLEQLQSVFPKVKMIQTYGLSEVGILKTKSQSNSSLLLKIMPSEKYETRIVDGMLQIKSKTSMLGYLNAQSPFTEDGWMITKDKVLVDDDGFMQILGRDSEMINVGGEKVFPAEIEDFFIQMDNIKDIAVTKEKSPIMGEIPVAHIVLKNPETRSSIRKRMKEFSESKLAPYKIPQKVILEDSIHNERFKKNRYSQKESL